MTSDDVIRNLNASVESLWKERDDLKRQVTIAKGETMACTLQMRQLLEAENADLKRLLREIRSQQKEDFERAEEFKRQLAEANVAARNAAGTAAKAIVELDAARTREKLLVEKLVDARDAIESWGGYASDYFQEKHGLQQQLDGIDKFIQFFNESEADDGG